MVDFVQEHWVDVDFEVLGRLHHIIDFLNVFPDCFEGVVMCILLEEVLYLQLVLQSQVHIFGLFAQFGVDIDSVAALQGLVERVELLGVDSDLEVVLVVLDLFDDREGAAYWPLSFLGVPIFEYPVTLAAFSAIEFVTLLAEVSNVFEIKF